MFCRLISLVCSSMSPTGAQPVGDMQEHNSDMSRQNIGVPVLFRVAEMQNGLGIRVPFTTSGFRIIPEVAGLGPPCRGGGVRRWRKRAATNHFRQLQTKQQFSKKGWKTSVHRQLPSLPTQKLPEAFLALRGNARPGMSENIGLQSGSSKRPFPKIVKTLVHRQLQS